MYLNKNWKIYLSEQSFAGLDPEDRALREDYNDDCFVCVCITNLQGMITRMTCQHYYCPP